MIAQRISKHALSPPPPIPSPDTKPTAEHVSKNLELPNLPPFERTFSSAREHALLGAASTVAHTGAISQRRSSAAQKASGLAASAANRCGARKCASSDSGDGASAEVDEEDDDEDDDSDEVDEMDDDVDNDDAESWTVARSPYRKWKMAVFSATNSDGSDSCASNHLRCCAAMTLRTRTRSMQRGAAAAGGEKCGRRRD